MADVAETVLVDEDVPAQVVAIVQDARKFVVFVSPYVELWPHAENAIELAIKRGVSVTAVVRCKPQKPQSPESENGVTWLLNGGVKVLTVENLHAKIYMNEDTIVVSSMNLTKQSAQNSHEIAWVIQNESVEQQIREYVNNRLMPLATSLATGEQAHRSRESVRSPSTSRNLEGHCIRCGRPIGFNPDRPLCPDCYDIWADFGNVDYPESYCHSCGAQALAFKISFDRPLCEACFRRLR